MLHARPTARELAPKKSGPKAPLLSLCNLIYDEIRKIIPNGIKDDSLKLIINQQIQWLELEPRSDAELALISITIPDCVRKLFIAITEEKDLETKLIVPDRNMTFTEGPSKALGESEKLFRSIKTIITDSVTVRQHANSPSAVQARTPPLTSQKQHQPNTSASSVTPLTLPRSLVHDGLPTQRINSVPQSPERLNGSQTSSGDDSPHEGTPVLRGQAGPEGQLKLGQWQKLVLALIDWTSTIPAGTATFGRGDILFFTIYFKHWHNDSPDTEQSPNVFLSVNAFFASLFLLRYLYFNDTAPFYKMPFEYAFKSYNKGKLLPFNISTLIFTLVAILGSVTLAGSIWHSVENLSKTAKESEIILSIPILNWFVTTVLPYCPKPVGIVSYFSLVANQAMATIRTWDKFLNYLNQNKSFEFSSLIIFGLVGLTTGILATWNSSYAWAGHLAKEFNGGDSKLTTMLNFFLYATIISRLPYTMAPGWEIFIKFGKYLGEFLNEPLNHLCELKDYLLRNPITGLVWSAIIVSWIFAINSYAVGLLAMEGAYKEENMMSRLSWLPWVVLFASTMNSLGITLNGYNLRTHKTTSAINAITELMQEVTPGVDHGYQEFGGIKKRIRDELKSVNMEAGSRILTLTDWLDRKVKAIQALDTTQTPHHEHVAIEKVIKQLEIARKFSDNFYVNSSWFDYSTEDQREAFMRLFEEVQKQEQGMEKPLTTAQEKKQAEKFEGPWGRLRGKFFDCRPEPSSPHYMDVVKAIGNRQRLH